MIKKNKNIKLTILLLLLIVVASTIGISAYFTSTDTKTNVFTVGNVDVELLEPNWKNNYPTTPNETITKDPQVKNIGNQDAYVFLEVKVPYANVVITSDNGTKQEQVEMELFSYQTNPGWIKVKTTKDEINCLNKHVYAYVANDLELKKLVPEETTTALFEEISFANIADNQGIELTQQNIVISAYGIETIILGDEITPTYVWQVITNQSPELLGMIMDGLEFKQTIPNEATKIVFTDEVAPTQNTSTFSLLRESTPEVIDVSAAQDNSVIAWLDGETYYVSTQIEGKKILLGYSARRMFHGKTNLTDFDFSNLDTSKTVDMFQMFTGVNVKNLDLRGFNVSNVQNFQGMFGNGSATSFESIDLSGWNTSSAITFAQMFYNCSNLKEIIGIESFNISNAQSTQSMFYKCALLENINVSSWNMSNVTNAGWMFYCCESLSELNVSSWVTDNITFMKSMFYGCGELQTLDVSNWNTSKVTDTSYMFAMKSSNGYPAGAITKLTALDVSNWDMSSCKDMGSMFSCCNKLVNLDVSKWDTSSCENMGWTFYGLSSMTYMDVKNLDTSKVKSMHHMFCHDNQLYLDGFEQWDYSSCETLNAAFGGIVNTTIDVSTWNTSKCESFAQLFQNCTKVEKFIGLEKLDTSNVKNFYDMFLNCYSLKELDLSNFDTRQADDNWIDPQRGYSMAETDQSAMDSMLKNLRSLEKIIIGPNFYFEGNPEKPSSKIAYFTDPTNIAGFDGLYTEDGLKKYESASIPNGEAVYYSINPNK